MRNFWLAGLTMAMVSALTAQEPLTPEQQAEADAAKLAATRAKMAQDQAKMAQEQARRAEELARVTKDLTRVQLVGVATPVKNAPYSAEAVTESTQTLADGNRIVQRSSSMQYRDTEGRERREEAMPGLAKLAPGVEMPQMILISDPVAGVSYTLFPTRRTANKTLGARGLPASVPAAVQKAENAAREAKAGASGQINSRSESLGTQMVEGVQAQGTRVTQTIPAGQVGNERPIEVISETWFSPDLKMNVMTKHSDPRTGEQVYRLTNIVRADPLRTLFEVPVDYKLNEAPGVKLYNATPGGRGGAEVFVNPPGGRGGRGGPIQ
jgi:hypothetical protein